ncbi:MAG: signal peptidase I, partial [Candidatus Poribacteria bacterium]|nr:signal peptidase I [Candidatus Poribacteria bacterium]
YQNRNSKQWYFITRTPKHEYRLTHTDATYTVPPDHYFAMGDNRENSEDSRSWGPVPFDVVKGKAVMVYWSTDGDSTAPGWQFWNRIRLERTGKRIRSQYGATPKRLSGNTSRR